MEHFVDDEEIRGTTLPSAPLTHSVLPALVGKRGSDVSADDANTASEAVRRSNFLPTSHRIRWDAVEAVVGDV